MNHAVSARFLLAVCFPALLFSGGARFAIGLLLYPMAYDLSWSRSTPSLNVTVFNDQWRIIFRWTGEGPDQVEVVDYHRRMSCNVMGDAGG